jgi:hypothetical protein
MHDCHESLHEIQKLSGWKYILSNQNNMSNTSNTSKQIDELVLGGGDETYVLKGPIGIYVGACVSTGVIGAVSGAVLGSALATTVVAVSPFIAGRFAYKYGRVMLHRAAGGTM